MHKKILILYTSIGLGHKSIAENIGFYLTEAGFEVSLFDAHKVQDSQLINSGGKIYPWLIKTFPFVWDWFYNTRWFISLLLPLRTKLAAFHYNHILEKINEIKPDLIISSHNTCSAVISYLKSKKLYNGKFGITFSDYHLHRFWLFENADFYLCNTEEQKQEMVGLGIAPGKIRVCGVVLKPSLVASSQQLVVRKELEIPDGHKVVLVSAGSQGIGLDESVIENLSTLENTSVVVVCGKDQELQKYYSDRFGKKVIVLGFYEPMEQLYAIADVFISKPGGLSVAEALRFYLPMQIFYVLPGGEKYNYQYLLNHKLVMPPAKDLTAAVSRELKTGEFRKSLQTNRHLAALLKDPSVLIGAVRSRLA